MRLSTIPYLRWAKTEQTAGEFPLTYSAVPALDWSELGLDPRELELCSHSLYGPEALLGGLGEEGGCPSEQVLLGSSASHVHFCFAAAHLSAGDRVLYESPGYLPLVDSLSMFQVEAVRYVRKYEDGFRLPVEQLRAVIEQMRPRLMLVTNLHNPSGVALQPDERAFLAEVCDRYGTLVLCDEVYRPFLDPDPGPVSREHPGIVSINSFNKAYGIPQIRVGWGFGSEVAVERARRVLDATTVHNSCLSDQVAEVAWERRNRLLERSRDVARVGWAAVEPWLASSSLEYVTPSAGLVCFPRVPLDRFPDGESFRARALEVGVGVVPGRFFEAPDHVRIGFGLPPEQLAESTARLSGILSG